MHAQRATGRRWQGGGQGGGLYVYMQQLAARLRRVRVCCGDWQRVLTPSVTTYIGTCGVFLDPPYPHDLRERCYAEDHDISVDVKAWALAHGDNPDFRIAYCGYEDGTQQFPDSWECVGWKAHGGYSRSERGRANRSRERIWFSPHCLEDRLILDRCDEESRSKMGQPRGRAVNRLMNRRSKYGAEPTVVHGKRFASKKEANRYVELTLLARAGKIKDLACQPRFGLFSGDWRSSRSHKLAEYVADFSYLTRAGEFVVEDVKGFRTPVYRLKKKWAEACHGITITEI